MTSDDIQDGQRTWNETRQVSLRRVIKDEVSLLAGRKRKRLNLLRREKKKRQHSKTPSQEQQVRNAGEDTLESLRGQG